MKVNVFVQELLWFIFIPCAEKVSAWAGIRTRIVMVYRFGVISAGVGGFKYSYKNCYGLSPTDRYGDYWYF